MDHGLDNAVTAAEQKNIRRTKWMLIVIGFAGLVMCLAGPRLVERLMNRRSPLLTGAPRYWGMLMGGFVCALLLFRLLYLLYVFLSRIEKGHVMTQSNVYALDGIIQCCFFAGIITGLIGLTCLLSFLAICMAASFMTIILRVIRHAFAGAVLQARQEKEKQS